MRSLFVSTERCRFGKSASLRMTSVAALLSGVAFTSSLAVAAEPVVSIDEPQSTSVTQSTTTTTVTTNSPSVAVAPLPPPPTVSATVVTPLPATQPLIAPTVISPLPAAPQAVVAPVQAAPPVGSQVASPIYFSGPVWIIPVQPGQTVIQPALPQQLPPPPVFVQPPQLYAPPPVARPIRPMPMVRRPLVSRPTPRGPVFGMGVRFTSYSIRSQEVFGEKPTLMGGGVQLRFRNQGHWGFELALDAARANIADGAFVRTSYPFTFAPMLYLFQNRPDRHFNIYATAGFGLMASDIALYQGSRQERNQQFWEVLGQAGGGMEFRFNRLALFADVRALGTLLDQGSEPGKFYDGVDSGPIAPSTIGYKLNIGAMLWF
ncbi:MAG: hypothetical protein JNM40_06935 [Myxococcales bacterium]|nr:hypothetical protein [Myxococcales bacterium]